MKHPLKLSALAAFVIAPWLVLAPPAVAAAPQCPCFNNTLLADIIAALDPIAITRCDVHPVSGSFILVAGVIKVGASKLYEVIIPHGFGDVPGDGRCTSFAPLPAQNLNLGTGGDAWTCMRQLTSTCRALGF